MGTELCLDSNYIGDEGVRALADTLEKNSTLTKLLLSWNYIGDEGASALARALEKNTTLRGLRLSTNRIGHEGARTLAHALENKNTTLTELYVYGNNFLYWVFANTTTKNTTLNTLKLLEHGFE